MNTSTFKLSLQIGATISQQFGQAIKSSQAQLGQLGSSLDKLKRQQALANKVQLAEANVGKARVAYNAASKELLQLRKAIIKTKKPSKQLQQQFAAAKQKVERLSKALAGQRSQLQRHRQALQRDGMSSSDLAHSQLRLGDSIERLTQKYGRLSRAMQRQQAIKLRRSQLRGQLFDAVALGTTVVAPMKVAVHFEQAIAKLGAITRASELSVKQLEKTASQLGETTQFTASEAASAMTYLGMAGFKTNQIIAATPGMLNLAQAAGSDLAQTADIASNILSGFSLKAKEMGRVGDVLAATFTTSNTTLQMLGDTLKYAAPVASSTGASIEELAAMTGLLGNVGIQGGKAGTVLRAAFLRLSAPPKEAADALADLGVEVTDLEGNLRPVPSLLKELGEATEYLGTAEKASAIKHIFGEKAAAGMIELLKQARSGALDRYITQLQQAQGTATKMALQMNKTSYGALKRLGSALESVAISLGSVLLPTVAQGAELFAGFASSVSKAAQEHPLLTKVVVGATAGLIGLKVVAIAGAYALTFLQGGVALVVTAFESLGAGLALARLGLVRMNVLSVMSAAGMKAMTVAQWALNVAMRANPIGLIVTSLAALAGGAILLAKRWQPLGDGFNTVWEKIKSVATSGIDWVLGKIQSLTKPLQRLGKLWHKVMDLFHKDKQHQVPTLGNIISAAPPSHTKLKSLPAKLAANSTHHQQTTHIHAPITIHAQPGMDEQAIAEEVQKALQQHAHEMQSQQCAALYDRAS